MLNFHCSIFRVFSTFAFLIGSLAIESRATDFPIFTETRAGAELELVLGTRAGGMQDPREKRGLMAYMARGILRGSVTRPWEDVTALFERLGIEASVESGEWHQFWKFKMPLSSFNPALDLVQDLFTSPAFDVKQMNGVQAALRGEIRQFFQSPQSLADWASAVAVFQPGIATQSPIGTIEGVGRLTPHDAFSAFESLLVEENLIVGVRSELSANEATERLRNHLKLRNAGSSSNAFPPQQISFQAPSVPNARLAQASSARPIFVSEFIPLKNSLTQRTSHTAPLLIFSRAMGLYLRSLGLDVAVTPKAQGLQLRHQISDLVDLGSRLRTLHEAVQRFGRLLAQGGIDVAAAKNLTTQELVLEESFRFKALYWTQTGIVSDLGALAAEVALFPEGEFKNWVANNREGMYLGYGASGDLPEIFPHFQSLDFLTSVEEVDVRP